MTPREAISGQWVSALAEAGPVALGYDVGTTERGTSNPSALAVMQHAERRYRVPLIVAWKSGDPAISRAVISVVLDDLSGAGPKPRRLSIDASSELYYATDVRRAFAARVAVDLIKANQKLQHRGQDLDAKTLLGNLYCSALEDGFVALPPEKWIHADHRLVDREAGGFIIRLGDGGQHGDTFVACQLAYWGLVSASGPAEAYPAQVGGFGSPAVRPGIKNPFAHMFDTIRRTINA